jgi:hypothetical protein
VVHERALLRREREAWGTERDEELREGLGLGQSAGGTLEEPLSWAAVAAAAASPAEGEEGTWARAGAAAAALEQAWEQAWGRGA